jgi:hypothetical protein
VPPQGAPEATAIDLGQLPPRRKPAPLTRHDEPESVTSERLKWNP